MAIKFEKLKAGETYYDRARTKMGNTTISTLSEWGVLVVSVDHEKRTAVVRWNIFNPPETWVEPRLRKLYDWSIYDEEAAEVVRGFIGQITSVKRKKVAK